MFELRGFPAADDLRFKSATSENLFHVLNGSGTALAQLFVVDDFQQTDVASYPGVITIFGLDRIGAGVVCGPAVVTVPQEARPA